MIDLNTVSDVVNSTGSLLDAVTNFLPKVVALSAVISAVAPKPQQPGLLSSIHGLINIFGLNVGQAKNKDG